MYQKTCEKEIFLAVLLFIISFSFYIQEFDDQRDADDAVYECNGREMLGER